MSCQMNGHDYSFNSWIDEKNISRKNTFPEPYTGSKNKIKFELNLYNFATKSD